MERVTGIGGVFFRVVDDAAVSRWYAEHLGVGSPPATYDEPVWTQEAGPTVFAPFGPEHSESPHIGPSGWGINFRVRDLDAMVEQLRSAGVTVEIDEEVYPNGRFAHLHDPQGLPVQLWEPMA
jgi:catechol 2,3-dioxygenase-like lactoylglutathione lyase family enzyme